MNDTPEMDAELGQRLRSYFAARYGEPPAARTTWSRVWSHITSDVATPVESHSAQREPRQTPGRPSRLVTRGRIPRRLVALAPIAAAMAIIVVAVYVFSNRPHLDRRPSNSGIWNVITLPGGITFDKKFDAFAVAPSDGATAYLCHASAGSPQVWKTTDGGHTWTRLPGKFTVTQYYKCFLVADEVTPTTIEMGLFPADASGGLLLNGPGASMPSNVFVSFDDAHWQTLSGADAIVRTFATHGDAIYGIRGFHLDVSHDQMRSWTQIDTSIFNAETQSSGPSGPSGQIYNVWVQSVSGRILVEFLKGFTPDLWTSADEGQHWTRIGLPSFDSAATPSSVIVTVGYTFFSGFIAEPRGNDLFAICVLLAPSARTSAQIALACSQDSGQTWTQPSLPLGYGDPSRNYLLALVGFDQRGSALLAGATNLANDSAEQGEMTPVTTTMRLLLLPPGATQASQWQNLGETHDTSPTLFSGVSGDGLTVWEQPYTPASVVYVTSAT